MVAMNTQPVQLFPLGSISATPSALRTMVRLGIGPNLFVDRHKIGDWGDLDEAFRQENDIPPSTDSGLCPCATLAACGSIPSRNRTEASPQFFSTNTTESQARFSWAGFYDVGYGAAYEHEGYAASVLEDGTDTGTSSTVLGPRVTGWRAACASGWRGSVFYPRAEWPSNHGMAPDEVDGWESETGCFVEWKAHVKEAVLELELSLYELTDLMQEIKNAWRRADRAVRKARAGGASWTTIGRVTGMTGESAHNRWSGLDSTPPTRT